MSSMPPAPPPQVAAPRRVGWRVLGFILLLGGLGWPWIKDAKESSILKARPIAADASTSEGEGDWVAVTGPLQGAARARSGSARSRRPLISRAPPSTRCALPPSGCGPGRTASPPPLAWSKRPTSDPGSRTLLCDVMQMEQSPCQLFEGDWDKASQSARSSATYRNRFERRASLVLIWLGLALAFGSALAQVGIFSRSRAVRALQIALVLSVVALVLWATTQAGAAM
jgi:hypothetical protein